MSSRAPPTRARRGELAFAVFLLAFIRATEAIMVSVIAQSGPCSGCAADDP